MMEVLIASAILMFCVTIAMSTLIYALRIQKSQRSMLRYIDQSNTFQRLMKQYAVAAQQYTTNNGATLIIEQTSEAKSQMAYSNGDGDDTTLSDNTITWTPDTASPTQKTIVMRGVYPFDAATPIFALESAPVTSVPGGKVLHVRMRMGDHSTVTNKDQGYTGLGYQSNTIDSYFTPRNSVSSSGGSF